jgi:hypothetical protein
MVPAPVEEVASRGTDPAALVRAAGAAGCGDAPALSQACEFSGILRLMEWRLALSLEGQLKERLIAQCGGSEELCVWPRVLPDLERRSRIP